MLSCRVAVALLMSLTISMSTVVAATPKAEPATPIDAHSHNDYWRDRPLYDALQRGFTSVEADVFLVDGALLVGHEQQELDHHKSLESLYLAPLAERIEQNGGTVYSRATRFILLVDIKTDASQTYSALNDLLQKYSDILTVWEGDLAETRAVTVVISGNRPYDQFTSGAKQYAGLDGRLSDLNSQLPPHVMPLISDNWRSHFGWNGRGPMPVGEREKLQRIVEKAHRAGRMVRFWATPEHEAVWHELQEAGVDLIGTDDLDRLSRYLRTSD